jgi:hypothetical protein
MSKRVVMGLLIGLLVGAADCKKLDSFADARVDDRSAADSQRSDGSHSDGPTTVLVSGTVTGAGPLSGMAICGYDQGKKSNNCQNTGADGVYALSVPKGVETGLFYDKAGYMHVFNPLILQDDLPGDDIGFADDAHLKAHYLEMGITDTPVGGAIVVNAPPEVSCRIDPAAGVGPMYFDSNWHIDPSLTTMQLGVGLAYIVNLPPANYTLVCTNRFGKCDAARHVSGWPSSTGSMTVPVLDGYFSAVHVECL